MFTSVTIEKKRPGNKKYFRYVNYEDVIKHFLASCPTSSDIDLNDGRLQQLFEEYQDRLKSIKEISISDSAQAMQSLSHEKQKVQENINFFSASKCCSCMCYT